MLHIFTYGSLMFDQVWTQVVEGSYQHYQATLPGFIRRSIFNEDYPAILPGRLSSTVSGILYLDVSSDDLTRLDAFEGSCYARQHVQVKTDNNIFAADAYVLKNEYRHLASEREWEPGEFEKLGLQRFLGSYFGFDQ